MQPIRLESQTCLTSNVITTLDRLGYFGFTIEGNVWGFHGLKNPWKKDLYRHLNKPLT